MMVVLWRQIVLHQEGVYAASIASQSLQCFYRCDRKYAIINLVDHEMHTSVPFSRRLRLYACS